MTQELDKKLVEKYPLIFTDRYKDETVTAMCWGVECNDGWYWLIDGLCDHIQTYIDSNKHLKIPQVVAAQVKEKFGTLRFYYDGGNEYIRGVVSHAEWLSGMICEVCGTTKNIGTTQGWNQTLCYDDWLKSNLKIWRNNETRELFEKEDNGDISISYTYKPITPLEHIEVNFSEDTNE